MFETTFGLVVKRDRAKKNYSSAADDFETSYFMAKHNMKNDATMYRNSAYWHLSRANKAYNSLPKAYKTESLKKARDLANSTKSKNDKIFRSKKWK